MSQKKPAFDPSAPIGNNVHRLRVQLGLSLPELAETSGVSEHLLADVEAGSLSPSIKLLWSLATALKVPFSTLVQKRADVAAVGAPRAAPEAAVRRSLLPPAPSPGTRTELHELKLPAHARERAERYPRKTKVTLLATAGTVVIETEHAQRVLHTGESLELHGDEPSAYLNPTDTGAVLYVMVAPELPR